MDTKLFKAVMTLAGDNCQTTAEALGITPQALSNKLNGKSDFTAGEISIVAKRWDLSSEALTAIFFADVVSCEDTSAEQASYMDPTHPHP